MPVNGVGPYDDSNIFARILRGEIPAMIMCSPSMTSPPRRRCMCW